MTDQMQCIITALKAESDPFIHHLELIRDPAFKFPCFRNDDLGIALVGVGVGKRNIRTRINNFFRSIDSNSIQFINIGIAGGRKDSARLGELFLINKIIDELNSKSCYPDVLTNSPIKENSITTVKKQIVDGGEQYDTLVDMEASEIFDVCSALISVHNIAFLKIVSDHMDIGDKNFDHESICSLIIRRMDQIMEFIEQFKLIGQLSGPILSDIDMDWIELNREKYLLTETQINQLLNSAKRYRLKNSSALFPQLDIKGPTSKTDRKKIFQDIRAQLKA